MSLSFGSGKVKEVGSCNFCTRGEFVSGASAVMKYPYKKVYILSGTTIEVRICAECLDKLKKLI